MYVGRIVAIGMNKTGQVAAMYRVSSRSFPNRQSKKIGDAVAIVPKKGFETDIFKNPYISYNCLRLCGDYAVATNGTQTDPITEKLAAGMGMRDAMATVLNAMDYEHDDYDTPRIAAIVNKKTKLGALGIVRQDALLVEVRELKKGEAFYVATYEHNYLGGGLRDSAFDVGGADEACDYVLGKGVFAELERPITAACAVENSDGFDVAHKDVVVR